MLKFLLMCGAMPFCMEEAVGDGAGAGGGAGGDGTPPTGSTGAGTATADGVGGKASMFGTGGGESDSTVDLKEVLGEELAANKTFEKFGKSENFTQDLAKAYAELEKAQGRPKIGVPGEQATPEEKAAFNKALGVPDSPEGYEFKKPDNLPEGIPYSEEHAAAWAKRMHELGVPKEMANAIRNAALEEAFAGADAQSAAIQEANTALNKTMDEAFGDRRAGLEQEIGDVMAEAIPDEKLREQIVGAMGEDQVVAMTAALAYVVEHFKKTYGQADTNHGEGGTAKGQTLDELREERKRIMATDAYRDRMNKDHAATMDKLKVIRDQTSVLLTQQQQKR